MRSNQDRNQDMMTRRARIDFDHQSILPITQSDDLWADELLFVEDDQDVFNHGGSGGIAVSNDDIAGSFGGIPR